MTSWATLTLDMMPEDEVEVRKTVPTGLELDSGIDDRGWLDPGSLFYALSFGRYQHLRFIRLVEEFHSPWFNGVRHASVVEAEDTADTAIVHVFEPLQATSSTRADGFRKCDEIEGRRYEDEDRADLKRRVEAEYGFRPRIEPVGADVPPDAIVRTRTGE